ncbi:MAG: ABC transporter ATP-binding protein [Planctomycetaceae bacterium]|jgi:tungstate transport system ATP-binding protein|nr:ABC transporter ATP-binding protein [Planctomycetaceae bacterium]MBT4013553.1 ABC transporter ATP-binding protein [Planctomycetaceae bacterium]MBT4725216.1 ABC transporter ATP-binding protein [Planctomycetaceae bacterium]MBT5123033.1 ABC transporter ATP-binding protein [Planctomycetaceae bacterium]MBT5598324.1 ABC transporter ATP-binding protein [Planctomycetaceae bacterium]
MNSIIQITDLQVIRGKKPICQVPTLEIQPNHKFGIVGTNGSGKTTLLRIIAGLEHDFQGTLHCSLPQNQIGFVHQRPYMFKGTVHENVCYGIRSMAASDRDALVQQMLESFKIQHLAHRSCQQLSGGEQRRVALARSLMRQPKLLLIDEPFADLDDEGIATTCTILGNLTQTTILISSPTTIHSALAINGEFVLDSNAF